ncbi:MAG: hypothetical protein HY961_16845 [Ignavibacteriae bacterium]|nr:hypothetical protein [Ignavibacteriota bacterium]
MTWRECKHLLLVLIFALPAAMPALAQQYQGKQLRPRQSQRVVIAASVGMAIPVGRTGLVDYWLNGVSGKASFQIFADSYLAFGLSTDIALLYFDEMAFAQRWPGVPLKAKDNLILGNVSFDATYSFFPGYTTRPFVSVQIGAEFISEASYKQMINGVRYVYYDVGGHTRLALGLVTGADIQLAYWLNLHTELKGTFIHNDPDVSMITQARVGVQYKF